MDISDIFCEAILLAAGRSRRMDGANKLLLPIGGEPLVRRSAQLYLDLGLTLTVVTGSDNLAVADALAGLNCDLVVNRRYRPEINAEADDGQQTSVLAGLDATPFENPGVIVALADQPLLTATDICALMAHFDEHEATAICVPRFAGKRGNPVIFPAAIAHLLKQPGSLPPRAFIDAHPQYVAWFDAPNDHFTRDIDTPADAAELLGTDFTNARTNAT